MVSIYSRMTVITQKQNRDLTRFVKGDLKGNKVCFLELSTLYDSLTECLENISTKEPKEGRLTSARHVK